VEVKEVNWEEYYARIKSVCPWSHRAFMNDKILVWEQPHKTMKTVSGTFDSTDYEAFVYVFKKATPQELEELVTAYNEYRPNSEFLWSHPQADSGDGNSTDVPVIIQQNKKVLTDLRDKLNGEHNVTS
jgi:hypothetical protein